MRARELRRSVSDFNRVVVGLGADRTSHPWESAYTNSKRLLFQAETLDVRNAYRAFGYLPECYPRVADDHIALECAFMAVLARKSLEVQDDEELACLEAGQRAFLQDHFLRWIGDYARDLRVDAPDGLYELTGCRTGGVRRVGRVCEGTAGWTGFPRVGLSQSNPRDYGRFLRSFVVARANFAACAGGCISDEGKRGNRIRAWGIDGASGTNNLRNLPKPAAFLAQPWLVAQDPLHARFASRSVAPPRGARSQNRHSR